MRAGRDGVGALTGPAPSHTTLADLGDGVFRKVRTALGVTAFGVNGVVLPPGTAWFRHTHERQDELYFVHRGRAVFEVGDERFELGAGGICHVQARTPRWFGNAGDSDLVLLVVGADDGYAGRDGLMVDPADEERRRRVAEGGPLPAVTPPPGTPPDRPR